MTFTSTPENYASLYAPLIYAFADEGEPRTLDISIENTSTGETIAVKRLTNTSSGEIDIAPLLRNRITVRPIAGNSFALANDRIPSIRVTVEDAVDTKRFLPTLRQPGDSLLLTSMPLDRTLCRGECDELTLLPGAAWAELSVSDAAGTTLRNVINPFPSSPALFRIDSSRWSESVSQIEVRFKRSTGELLATVRYRFVPRPAEALRAAWFSRSGSIEHYTFPVRAEVAERQERQSLRMGDGEEQTTGTAFEERTAVLADQEPQEVRQALAELGTARFAWAGDRAGEYVPVTAEAGEPAICRHGLPAVLRFTLRPTQKNRSLWS